MISEQGIKQVKDECIRLASIMNFNYKVEVAFDINHKKELVVTATTVVDQTKFMSIEVSSTMFVDVSGENIIITGDHEKWYVHDINGFTRSFLSGMEIKHTFNMSSTSNQFNGVVMVPSKSPYTIITNPGDKVTVTVGGVTTELELHELELHELEQRGLGLTNNLNIFKELPEATEQQIDNLLSLADEGVTFTASNTNDGDNDDAN